MKAVLWPYRFEDMMVTWQKQVQWLVNALQHNGIEVKRHPRFICKGLDHLPLYDHTIDNPTDICIYNHADVSHIIGDVLKSKVNWFFKPTAPDPWHTTLDELGYGAYSSITYEKPDFEKVSDYEVEKFFNTQVKEWMEKRTTKWGQHFKHKEVKVPYNDYYLVLGQVGSDEVVTHQDFGDYFTKMFQIVKELTKIDNRTVVVKLHPYTDGKDLLTDKYSKAVEKRLLSIHKNVKVFRGSSNVHNFIKNARCVLLANSGAGFEVMMHSKPIISWGHPEYRWITYDLLHLSDLIRAIELDWFDKKLSDKFLYWYMEKYCFYNQETANNRVAELLNKFKSSKLPYKKLWELYRPAQGYTEFKNYLNFIKDKLPSNPVVVEIGLRAAHQRFFYKELFNADYRGIDIVKFKGEDFIHGDSKDPKTLEELKRFLNGRKIDLLFIDGDHSYEGVKKDFEMYAPLANIIAMHDVNTRHHLHVGVAKFWNELLKSGIADKKKVITFIQVEGSYKGDGIGVIMDKKEK